MTKAGRPRDPGRDEAILSATLELLGEVGYEQVTVRAIARRAGTGLGTLYRRWSTKEELVIDAVARLGELPDLPTPSDDPVEDLVEILSSLVDVLQGPGRELIPNLIGQLPANPALAETLRTRLILPRLAVATKRLRTVSGVDPHRVKRAAELIPAAPIFQILLLGRVMSKADVRHVVDLAVRAAQ